MDYQHGTVENSYLFTGEQYDNNVGFYYLRARYYNPEIGRFSQMDTYAGRMNEPATLHKYLYTHGDPVNNIDPSGYLSLPALALGVGIGAIIGEYALNHPLIIQRLTFREKYPVAYIDFSRLNVPRIDNAFLKNFILAQANKYYSPYGIKIKSGKGSLLDRNLVFAPGANAKLFGETLLYSSRVWAEDIADYWENIKTVNSVVTMLNPEQVAMAISNTVAHELGHTFGLRHNINCLGFIMDDGGCIYNDINTQSKELMFSPDSHRYLSSRGRN